MALQCSRHTSVEIFDDLRAEWDRLDAQTMPRRPYSSELWNRLWWSYFRRQNKLVRDELSIFTVRDDAGQLIAVAPMRLTHRPPSGPLRVRKLQFLGADQSLTELRGLVCRPQDQLAATKALSAYFQKFSLSWDILRWDGLRADSEDVRAVASSADVRSHASLANYVIDLPDDFEKIFARFSQNMRRKARKACSDLEKDGHNYSFRVVTSAADTSDALSRFVDLYHQRVAASTELVSKRNNRLGTPERLGFILDYCKQMADRGHLCVFQIEISGHVVATQLAFRVGDDIYMSFSGFDPVWARYNVMTTLMIEALKWAIANNLRGFNLSCGRDLQKLRWNPRELTFQVVTLTRPNVRGRALAYAYDAAIRVRDYARRRIDRSATAAPAQTDGRQSGLVDN